MPPPSKKKLQSFAPILTTSEREKAINGIWSVYRVEQQFLPPEMCRAFTGSQDPNSGQCSRVRARLIRRDLISSCSRSALINSFSFSNQTRSGNFCRPQRRVFVSAH